MQKFVKSVNRVVANVPWSIILGLFRKCTERNGDKESKDTRAIQHPNYGVMPESDAAQSKWISIKINLNNLLQLYKFLLSP